MLRNTQGITLAIALLGTACGSGQIGDAADGLPKNGTHTGTTGQPGTDGGIANDPNHPGTSATFVPAAAALRKLTVAQYQSSVRDLLGQGSASNDITVPTDLEADTAVNGFFAIGAAKATVSPVAAEKSSRPRTGPRLCRARRAQPSTRCAQRPS
jgi:hypothetical protein